MERRKITVKHYLNYRAKEKLFQKEKFFPLYIQIIVNGKKAQIKSRIHEFLKIYKSDIERIAQSNQELLELISEGYFSEKFLTNIDKKKIFPLAQLLLDEVTFLKRIIAAQKPFENPEFTLYNFGWEYQVHSTEITKIFDDYIKADFKAQVREVFLKTIDVEDNRSLFQVANYFLNFIDWSNSFHNFYEATNLVMPEHLRQIESLLSKDLLVAIKAYQSYLSKVNILSRLFERRQEGRIATLSFLDWQTEIKAFVYREFIVAVGEQSALEYIISLDNILLKAIKGQ